MRCSKVQNIWNSPRSQEIKVHSCLKEISQVRMGNYPGNGPDMVPLCSHRLVTCTA